MDYRPLHLSFFALNSLLWQQPCSVLFDFGWHAFTHSFYWFSLSHSAFTVWSWVLVCEPTSKSLPLIGEVNPFTWTWLTQGRLADFHHPPERACLSAYCFAFIFHFAFSLITTLNFFFFFFLDCVWVFVAACGLSLVAASGDYSLLWCAGFLLQ